MNGPSTPSLAGPARRSRRLQGTASGANVGHTGSATTASGSPYARRPGLHRDSSSQTLAALESGSSGRSGGTSQQQDQDKLNRRKSVGASEGLLGRFKRWLGGGSRAATSDDIVEDDNASSRIRERDEESLLNGSSRLHKLPSSNNYSSSTAPRIASNLQHVSNQTQNKRLYHPTPSVLSSLVGAEGAEASSAKKLRTSHSTLNLPTSPPRATRTGHASDGPATGRLRSPSPQRPLSPRARGLPLASTSAASIFPSGPFAVPTSVNGNGGSTYASRRSVSPGAASQHTLGQLASTSNLAFGLQSQSPFRSVGRSARSPDFAALNISNGLARSPSLPRERLNGFGRRGSRLYPYQRSPSILSGIARTSTLVPSHSLDTGLAGTKRSYGATSYSPPKGSPLPHSAFRASPGNMHISPVGTEFGSEHSHRSKRPRLSVVWHPEKGFIQGDADGRTTQEGQMPAPEPKNEAEKILQRLESTRSSQIAGLRSSSPRRISVPVPATTPAASGSSIFATHISAPRLTPSLSSHAISPQARRQQLVREERAQRRSIINTSGGLGTHLQMENNAARDHSAHNTDNAASDSEVEYVRSDFGHDMQDGEGAEQENPDEAEDTTIKEDVDPETIQPVGKRTRQRTREASVMSDGSVQQDAEPAFSPRRSTRMRKPEQTPQDSQRSTRTRKSAKSPPAASTSGTKQRNNPVVSGSSQQTDDKQASATQNEKPGPSKQASPKRAKSPVSARQRARAVSPSTSKRDAGIEQVMSSPSREEASHASGERSVPLSGRSAREERLSRTQGRKLGAFSARDDPAEDSVEEISTISNRVVEQPKLKLPSSVFANRFSFGRSPSTSNLPSPKMLPTVPHSDDPKLEKSLDPTPSTQSLPKFALPPSLQSQTASNAVSASHTASPAPGPSSQTSIGTSKAGIGAFNSAGNTDNASQATTKPLFSFNAAAPSSPAPPTTSTVSQAPSAISNGASNVSEKAAVQPPVFAFGNKSSTPALGGAPEKQETKNTVANASPPNDAPKPAPSFSFSVGNNTPASAAPAAPAKPANPFAAFPSTSASATDNSTSQTVSKAPSFSFGNTIPAASSPAAVSSPSFSFQAQPPVSKITDSASPSQGLFGAAPATVPKSTEAPGSSVAGSGAPPAQATKPPTFTFGQTPSAPSTSNTPGPIAPLAFGQSKPAEDTKSRSASPFAPAPMPATGGFGSGNPAPTFNFSGVTATPSASTQSTPAPTFNFGGSSTTAANGASAPAFGQAAAAKPASSNPFAAVSGAPTAVGAFGTTSPAVTSSAPAPTFAFGAASTKPASTPTFSFGSGLTGQNQANGQGSATTSFGFGGSSSSAAAAGNVPSFNFSPGPGNQTFAFGGAPNAGSVGMSAVPSFSFGAGAGTQPNSPAGTPTDNGPPGGLFNMGAGDEATSPNKARRPVKPLRRAR